MDTSEIYPNPDGRGFTVRAGAGDAPATLGIVAQVVSAFESQVTLNNALSRALEGMTLAQERYDSELQEIRERLDALEAADALTVERFDVLNRLGSVKL